MTGHSRRAFLRAAAGSAATGLAAAVAGCQAVDDLLGSTETGGAAPDREGPPVSVPDPGEPWYRRWVPARGPADPLDAAAGGVAFLDFRRLRRAQRRLAPATDRALRNAVRTRRDYLGVPPAAVDRVTKVDLRVYVVEGRFAADVAGETLAIGGYRTVGTVGDVTLFTREDSPRAAAVADGLVVWADGPDPLGAVRLVLDAGRGRRRRYHEQNPVFRKLTDRVGGTLYGTAAAFAGAGDGGSDGDEADSPRESSGVVGVGSSLSTGDDRLYRRTLYRYAAPGAVDPYALDETVDPGPFTRRSVRADGALLVGAESAPLDAPYDLRSGPSTPPGTTVPVVTWSFDLEARGDTVTVTHAAGDRVRADRLTLFLGYADEAPTQFSDTHDAVTPGDAVTLSTDGADRVRVAWGSGGLTMRNFEF